MSSRYVWGRYVGIPQQELSQIYKLTSETVDNEGVNLTKEQDYMFWLGTGCTCDEYTGKMSVTGTKQYQGGSGHTGDTYGAGYILLADNTVLYSSNWKAVDEVLGMGYGLRGGSRKYSSYLTTEYYTVYTQGEFIEWVSSSSSYSYPYDEGDEYDGYYYGYEGRDNIDPQSVSLPSSIMGGTAAAIIVDPSDEKVYEGTVSYDYQYRLNGGSWQTAENGSFEVPEGTSSVQARARAKDDIGFTSSTWVTSGTVTVRDNQPPGAPGSITASNVVSGRYATITLTSASDPDGYIANYIYERSIDGGSWQQITVSGSLSVQDQVSEDWATVQYRACAVDNNGAQGPYVTGQLYTLNTGYIMIAGPDGDLGTRRGPFGLSVTIGVSGESGGSVTDIAVTVTLDGETIYSGVRDAGEDLTVIIDTRFLKTGSHTVQIVAEKGGAYMPATAAFVFDVPVFSMSLLEGARAGLIQNSQGEGKLPYTLAQMVIVDETGKTLADVLEDLAAPDEPETPDSPAVQTASGTYTGAGTYGQTSRNSLTFDFEPELLVVAAANYTSPGMVMDGYYGANIPYLVWTGQPGSAVEDEYGGTAHNAVSVSGQTIRWYSVDAASQLNARNTQYYYFAAGRTGA